jgi:hypothetical protein
MATRLFPATRVHPVNALGSLVRADALLLGLAYGERLGPDEISQVLGLPAAEENRRRQEAMQHLHDALVGPGAGPSSTLDAVMAVTDWPPQGHRRGESDGAGGVSKQ